MIPLCVPNLSGNEGHYLQQCIETTFVSSVGPFVRRFEEEVASACDSAGAVATSSGTTALHLALVAAGVGPGDLVVLPSYTFIASANAISHCGATPWLFDIDPASWTLDPALLADRLAAETERRGDSLVHIASGRRVAAVMPVYTLGTPADMDPIVMTAREFGLPVVADAAAAIGATYKGRALADMGADLSGISFNGNKTVTSGGGGAVIGNDADVLDLVRHLSSTARVGSDYSHDRIGYNYRMTNLQAAVGCAQMENMAAFVGAKRRIRATYDRELAGLPGVEPFPQPDWARSGCWFSGVVLSEPAPPAEDVRQRLRTAGIEARPFWKPMHLQAPYADAPRTGMTVSDGLWHRVLTLPCSSNLSASEQAFVIDLLKEALA
ncbi:MAG: aminotransferase class I/II-fold pyridoxal phosphate-dependent enzyme [Magnetospirillum sp.]|nr:aminotransferase class I/II-fold pyridoxal phosphate-dependent enzyme [Magnetospirillum sp.]